MAPALPLLGTLGLSLLVGGGRAGGAGAPTHAVSGCRAAVVELMSGSAGSSTGTCGAGASAAEPDAALAGLAGYYTLAPAEWAGVAEQARPVFHQRYCPNATSPAACVGAAFLYHSDGHWVVARRLWAPPRGYHAVLHAPSDAHSPGDAGGWQLVSPVGGVAQPTAGVSLRCVAEREGAAPQCERHPTRVRFAQHLGEAAAASLRRVALPPDIADPAVPSWRHRVLTFPLLAASDCRKVVELAESHAAHRGGWWSDRHGKHTTVDIQVDERAPALDTMLRPMVTALETFVSAEASLRANGEQIELVFNDVFVVKYDSANGGQRSLGMHVDGSLVSFQLALNDFHGSTAEFAGGGTYLQPMDCIVSLRMGEVMTFPGQLIHGGVALTDGVRYALVGFGNRKVAAHQAGSGSDSGNAAGGYYDQPAGVDTGDAFRVVEGSARGPRLVVHVAAPPLDNSPGQHAACKRKSSDEGTNTSSCSTTAADRDQAVALGVSVAWDGCPAPHGVGGAGFSLGLHTTDQDVGVLWVHHQRILNCKSSSLGSHTADLSLPLAMGFKEAHNTVLFAYPPNHTFAASKLSVGPQLPAEDAGAAVFPWYM